MQRTSTTYIGLCEINEINEILHVTADTGTSTGTLALICPVLAQVQKNCNTTVENVVLVSNITNVQQRQK